MVVTFLNPLPAGSGVGGGKATHHWIKVGSKINSLANSAQLVQNTVLKDPKAVPRFDRRVL